ncbi:MAG: haloacid dehalogenase-like hydrolase [Clostridia bacterium]|nr:haloacid dehalogenase-like hydrolase [Clostridia bacterium]
MSENILKYNGYEAEDDWPIVAICYDFDKTLSPQDMQNFTLIPNLLKCDVDEFWRESNDISRENGMDKILAYMMLILDKAKAQNMTIRRDEFVKLGKTIELFEGVKTWFERINKIAQKNKIHVEHYIISAGLKAIIEGTCIAKHFTAIFASTFLYNSAGEPIWPSQVVNYTAKTQFLYRISKNCLDMGDEKGVNEQLSEWQVRIPFKNFIYIGDSDTDIPAMRIVKKGGGTAIGVYNPETIDVSKVSKLLLQNRIDYFMPAVYTKGSRLERLTENLLKRIRASEDLAQMNKRQNEYVKRWDEFDKFIEHMESLLQDEDIEQEDFKGLKRQTKAWVSQFKQSVCDEFSDMVTVEEIEKLFKQKESLLNKCLRAKQKELKGK